MVMFNISMNLDMANEVWGNTVNIVLDERGSAEGTHLYAIVVSSSLRAHVDESNTNQCVQWAVSRRFSVVVPMTGTCIVEWEMDIDLKTTTAHHTCICYHQLSCPGSNNTSAWSTYLGSPPSGWITPSYAYRMLSLSRGRDTIQLLHDFDEQLFTRHPSKHFQEEATWLQRLARMTKMTWDAFQIRQGVCLALTKVECVGMEG